ncbi:hypothetical protein FRC02_006644, partial [Tulasnella sp. 418]
MLTGHSNVDATTKLGSKWHDMATTEGASEHDQPLSRNWDGSFRAAEFRRNTRQEIDMTTDLKIYETGPSTNKVLHNILERLYLQYEELVMVAYEASESENKCKNAENLHVATQGFLKALYLPLPKHPLRSATMDGLASCLYLRYEEHENLEDLKECVSYGKGALLLCHMFQFHRWINFHNCSE